MFKIIKTFLFFSIMVFALGPVNLYWEHVAYNKWHEVPFGEGYTVDKVDLSLAESLFKDADFIGILYPTRYQKFKCDTESLECAKYKAKILTVFKGNKRETTLVFIDDLTNAPDVYKSASIFILHKDNNIYYQDDFFQIKPTKEWLKVFKNLTIKYKNQIQLSLQKIQKFPNRTVAYINLGDAYWELGEKNKAKKAYTTYIEQMCYKGLQEKIPKQVLERIEQKKPCNQKGKR